MSKDNSFSSYLRAHKGAFFTAMILFSISLLLNFLARSTETFGPWYTDSIYSILPNTLGRLLSPIPFSLFELLIVLAVLCAVLILATLVLLLLSFLISLIFRSCSLIFRSRIAAGTITSFPLKAPPLQHLSSRCSHFLLHRVLPLVLCTLAVLFFMQTLTCLLNYSRRDFTAEAGLATYPATNEDLTTLCYLLIDDLNELLAPVDPVCLTFDEPHGLSLRGIDLAQQSKAAMSKLGRQYPSLSGYYPNPKPIYFSKMMSTLNLTGIFSPYTTEANYNRDVTNYVIPYTICHELAHVKGHIKENEAGFIAYLACSGADSPQFRYSGALNALSYSLNALYRSVPEDEYQQVLRAIPTQALTDLQRNQAYWQDYRQGVKGTISNAAGSVNDHYLKANAQSDGAKSYGRMVDLLLAYYKIGVQGL